MRPKLQLDVKNLSRLTTTRTSPLDNTTHFEMKYLLFLASVAVAVQAAPKPDPAVHLVPAVPAYQGKYHAQDELGQYSFGHHEPNQVRHETKDVAGVVRGSYSYVGSDGKLITNHYIADQNGFRSSLAPSNGPLLPVTGKIQGVPVTATVAQPVAQPVVAVAPTVYSAPAVAPAAPVVAVEHPKIKVAPAAHVVPAPVYGTPYAYNAGYYGYAPVHYTPYAYAAHAW